MSDDEKNTEPYSGYVLEHTSYNGKYVIMETNEIKQPGESGEVNTIAAIDANIAAAAAEAAAINQAQIIGVVTEAAREDAERARSEAECAADEAEQAAELAAVVSEVTIEQVRQMLEEHNGRITALENRPTHLEKAGDEVSTISPGQVETASREESMGGEQEEEEGRKRHGRRRR